MIEEEKVPDGTGADARIVQAVRKLKKSNTKCLNDSASPDIKNKESKSVSREGKSRDTTRTMTTKEVKKIIRNAIPVPSTSISKVEGIMKRDSGKILLDGSIKKPKSEVSKNEEKKEKCNNSLDAQSSFANNKKTFDYETLKKYKKKQKTEFQKNILSPNNIEKMKEECVNFIKKDKNIKNLINKLNLVTDNDYLPFIENNFFNNPYFLTTLEMLIMEDIEEANTLKVFRTKNVLPLKVVKENFYKDEIEKTLKKSFYDLEYKNKFLNFKTSIINFDKSLQEFDFNV